MDLSIIWNLDAIYVISQIFVLISYSTLAATFVVKDRKKLLAFLLISIASQAVTFFLLSAWSAFWMVGVALIRTIAYLVHDKIKARKQDTASFVCLFV